jgi:hypothetical protein
MRRERLPCLHSIVSKSCRRAIYIWMQGKKYKRQDRYLQETDAEDGTAFCQGQDLPETPSENMHPFSSVNNIGYNVFQTDT